MRFSRLSLERYGRFEDCTLDFRPGPPDLHLIYGANEAGKSTTLSAVSDLLFGFPARTPFNFRYENALLRIGAVLEAEGQSLACRRRKTAKAAEAQSLVDAQDRPIDAGPLRAMLHGQDRERFRLGFSLDQTRLREGGRAMVEAKDDVGQALFAAGSGMTGVAAALTALEVEADLIWGRRAAARRLYTVAERQYEDAQRSLRDAQLKPKAWSDARDTLDLLAQARADREAERAELTAERRRVERLRRTGADLRRRTELLEALASGPSVVRLSAQAETAVEAALTGLDAALRARAAASALIEELDARLEAQTPDVVLLDAAPAVEALVERRGAEQKAAADLGRLQIELAEKRVRKVRLQGEIGAAAPIAPRLAIARLRELATRIGQANSTLATLKASAAEAEESAGPLRLDLADADVAEGLGELAAAVDAARALGSDVDARCAAVASAFERLQAQARAALERLAPWSGTAADLAALPSVASEEIGVADAAALRARDAAEAEGAAVERAETELETLALKRRQLTEGGQAVAAERIDGARADRDGLWTGLRNQLLGGVPLADPAGDAVGFEAAIRTADTAADQRFALAEASGRLAALDVLGVELNLTRTQAQGRRDRALNAAEAAANAWRARLAARGLPELEPARLRGWLEMRREARDADAAVEAGRAALAAELARRSKARAWLAAHMPGPMAADEALAPLLAEASRLRAEGDARNQRFLTNRAALRGLDDQLASLRRQAARTESDRAALLSNWEGERAACGLDLQVETAEDWFQILDELRGLAEEAEKLDIRIAGIERDRRGFAVEVDTLADRLGEPPDADAARRLEALRLRLAAARSAADARKAIKTTLRARREELNAAEAARDAAETSLAPRLIELGAADIEQLPTVLEGSRQARRTREALAEVEQRILDAGDGYTLEALAAAFALAEPDQLAGRLEALDQQIAALDARISEAADAVGAARRTFEGLETAGGAPEAAADAALARAEMDAQAESFLLKRAQAVTLRWAVERYREQRQNPLLARASELFATLTLGRYAGLQVDLDAARPRLLGLCEDRASLIEVDHMSEGTTDQLFLALRLAAVEQAIAGGVRLPFLADDLFVNFDDARALAGLKVLSDLARTTQVLIFTHHSHLRDIAREAVGVDVLSECQLHS